jgi:hypothetical protein
MIDTRRVVLGLERRVKYIIHAVLYRLDISAKENANEGSHGIEAFSIRGRGC